MIISERAEREDENIKPFSHPSWLIPGEAGMMCNQILVRRSMFRDHDPCNYYTWIIAEEMGHQH